MSKIGDLWIYLGLKKEGLEKGLEDAKKKSKSSSGSIISDFKKIAVHVTAAIAAIRGFVQAFKVISDFERANSTLAAVLGTTKDNIKGLTQSALELGRSTEYTASEVTGLQVELARLGFSEKQITGMQESILKFAAAVGTDLSSAAARAGATMRGFGLTTQETTEMLSVMAVSTSKSALSFSYLDSSLGKFVPVAKAAGLDIKDAVALLGTLADRGIDASSASTGLKNILLSMGTSAGKAAKSLGGPVHSMDELLSGLDRLKNNGADLATIFGKYSYAVAEALADATTSARLLRGELEDTDGALNDMYHTMTDNVEGSIKRLQSAWEGFILSMSKSKGPIKAVIDFLTDNVTYLTNIISGKGVFDKSGQIEDRINRTVEDGQSKGYRDIDYDASILKLRAERGSASKKRKKEIDEEIFILEQAHMRLKKASEETANAIANFGEPENEDSDPLTELLKKLKKTKDPLEEIKRTATSLTRQTNNWLQDMKEQAAGDAKDTIRELNDEWEKYSGMVDEATRQLEEFNQVMAEIDYENSTEIDKLLDDLNEMKALAEEVSSAIVDGLADGLQILMDQFMGLDEMNGWAVVQGLLDPLADMASQQGKLLVMQGLAIDAVKSSLNTLQGGVAIAAGTALIATAAAVKSGLASLASGSKGSAGTATSSAAASGQGMTQTQYEDMNINVKIEGRLKGSDIVLASRGAQASWAR